VTATLEAARVAPPAPSRRIRWPLSRRYLLGRLANAALAVWAVFTIVFFALHISGDPSVVLLGPDATPADVARVHDQMGLDHPLIVQYLLFLGHSLTGELPDSVRYGTSPVSVVFDRLPATLLLGATGLGAGALVGLSAGYYAAAGAHARLRRIPVSILTALEAIPSFFLGVLLLALFTITWAVLAMTEEVSAASLVLPAAVIAFALAAPIARVFRASLLDAFDADHVRLAESKGLSRRAVTLRHVVLNALGPVVNVLGVQAGVVLGGAVVTESVFRWPGVGQLATSAFETRDYPLVLATVTLIAIGFVAINLVVDLVGAILDPRGARR
jgi:peptide/nickel transport system permease protein